MIFEAADVKTMQTSSRASCSSPATSLHNLTQAKAVPTADAGATAAEEPKPVYTYSVHGPTHFV